MQVDRQQHGAAILVQFNALHRRQGGPIATRRVARAHFRHTQHHAEYGQGQGFVVLPLVFSQQRKCADHPIVVSHRIEEPGHRHGLRQLRDVAAIAIPDGRRQALALQLGRTEYGRGQRAMRLTTTIAGEVIPQHSILVLQRSCELGIKIQ